MDSSDIICMYILFVPVLIVAFLALLFAGRQRSTFPVSARMIQRSGLMVLAATLSFFLFTGSDSFLIGFRLDWIARVALAGLWSILMGLGVMYLSRAASAERQPIESAFDDDE